jgi:hypothetical protein
VRKPHFSGNRFEIFHVCPSNKELSNLLSKLQFSTLTAFEASFYFLPFVEKTFFQKSKMADFSKMMPFLRKYRLFFKRVLPILNSTFFKFSISNLVQRPKKLPKKIFQDGGYFQNGVCTFFSYENMSCDRYFRSIELISGLSHYFLTFNRTKINLGFLDHPNMRLSFKILVNK